MKKVFYILSALLFATACTDKEDLVSEGGHDSKEQGEIIRIGGVETQGLAVSVSESATRAAGDGLLQDAETVPWLVTPLKEGLDITYGKVTDDPTKINRRVAILQLQPGTNGADYAKDPDTQWALYTFKYKDNGQNAIWYDNGEHFFEGVYVPEKLRYGSAYTAESGRQELSSVNASSAKNLLTDQSKDGDNDAYTLLTRYLAMPANTQISATLGRIKLPFRHRLSRVFAYVLIDPEMGANVTLKGFSLNAAGKDDPSNTSIRFCNVEVLEGVEDTKNSDDTHVLTPHWNAARKKVIPHFWKMSGSEDGVGQSLDPSFIMFYDDKTATYVFPTDETWADYYAMTDAELTANKITKTVYGENFNGKVPVYDIIVRPTYSTEESVMYDEDLTSITKKQLEEKKNHIEFELTLSNGLIYTKAFDFDLDANYQTVVYLRISRESVDYNSSGSALWIDSVNKDDWYGVDNRGDHSLSIAGSSWQRAYTYGSDISSKPDNTDKVTDGGFYNETTTPDDGVKGQYLEKKTWIERFAQAYEGGEHHGDYFILTSNIDIDAKALPDNFVFTGHLDAQGHKITLSNAAPWTEYVETNEYDLYLETTLYTNSTGTAIFSMPALYQKVDHEAEYYQESDLTEVEGKTYVTETLKLHSGEKDAEGKDIPNYYEVLDGTSKEANVGDLKKAAWTEWVICVPQPSLADVVQNSNNYYENNSTTPYSVSEIKFYKAVTHNRGAALFAGLNGNYNAGNGEANVHLENGIFVPYRTSDSDYSTGAGSGWRAEVINLDIEGKLFETDAVITGNVQNCYEISTVEGDEVRTKVPNRTPALPKYD